MSNLKDVAGILISLGLFGFLAYIAYFTGDVDLTDRSRGILNFLEVITNAVVSRLGQTNGALLFIALGLMSAAYYVVRMRRQNQL